MEHKAAYLPPGGKKKVFVNRGQVAIGKERGESGAVWVVEVEVDGVLLQYSCYEFYASSTARALPQLTQERPDYVSVYLEFDGQMLLRLVQDPLDPDWLTAYNFFNY